MLIRVFHDIHLALTLSGKVVSMRQGKVTVQSGFQTLTSKEFLQTISKTGIVSYLRKQHEVWRTIQ